MSEKIEEVTDYEIWPPYEIFYIESMLTIARSAMEAQSNLQDVIRELYAGKPITEEISDLIIDLVQNILICSASISRYFWPVGRDKVTRKRGHRLREAFNIQESNPLKDRETRNFIEHFDEKLDQRLTKTVAGTFMPIAVGSNLKKDQATHYFFRAFHIDDWTFEALDMKVEIIPIVNEIIRIYLLLEKFKNEGGRLPKKNISDER